MNLSFVIVSFKSFHLIEKHIQSIENNNQVTVIENSLDKNEELQLKYSINSGSIVLFFLLFCSK